MFFFLKKNPCLKFLIMPLKRKSAHAKPKTVNAKRRKPAKKANKATQAVISGENTEKVMAHVNMCVDRVNLLLEHVQFIQNKMFELAKVTNGELERFHFELENLRSAAYKTRDDAYGLFPGFSTDTETASISDGEDIMSEEMLIEAVGGFADSLP